jgi:RNase adapter protein RapZ
MEFVIITGLSGAGKSRAAEFLEDAGFYTVDNIPPEFMTKFAEFCMHTSGRYDRVALVSDVRAGDDFSPLLKALDDLKDMGCDYQLLFMEADLPTIIKRYKETRRSHPLTKPGQSLEDAANRERAMLQPVRDRATYVLDTTPFASTNMLRAALEKLFKTGAEQSGLSVNVMSFGYKYGLPLEADLVLDVRFLPNPYYVAGMKEHTGKDADVMDYIFSFDVTTQFLKRLEALLDFLLPQYAEEGKRTLTIAIGCTGGRHRSVAIASVLAEYVRTMRYTVAEYHRDMTRA